ncbi:helix-turn-helix transcriptional regulator [Flavobacteriaceae bacterium]|nr:helix-turn-helix transcriptional regulator [Flavobacteriaceae bacterium]
MLNQDEFISRIQELMNFYQISAANFADEINVQRSSISHLLSGRNKPSLEFILKITENYKEVNIEWLLYGRGSMSSNKETTPKKIESPNPSFVDKNSILKTTTTTSEIERIVIFYKNGSFKEYSGN